MPRYHVGQQIKFDRVGTTPIFGQVVAVSPTPTINGHGHAITWRAWLGEGEDRHLSLSENVHSDVEPRITAA